MTKWAKRVICGYRGRGWVFLLTIESLMTMNKKDKDTALFYFSDMPACQRSKILYNCARRLSSSWMHELSVLCGVFAILYCKLRAVV